MSNRRTHWFWLLLALVLPQGAEAVVPVPTQLDDGTTIDVYSNFGPEPATVQALVREADRSTRKVCSPGTSKGLFSAGDSIFINRHYIAWFDYTPQDGVAFPTPPFLSTWHRAGALAGWWTLDPATGDFKHRDSGTGPCHGWAPNELIPGSATIPSATTKYWWDRHAPPFEVAINVCGGVCNCDPNQELPACYMAHHYAPNAPAGAFTRVQTGDEDGAGVHFRTKARLTSHPLPNPSGIAPFVDISDRNDANGIAQYIESDVEYIAQADAMHVIWRFRPVGTTVLAKPLLAFLWASYANPVDNTDRCDYGGPGQQWPALDPVNSRPLFVQSTNPLTRSHAGDVVARETIVPLEIGTACTNTNYTISTTQGVGNGTALRLGESSLMLPAKRQWQFTARGVPGSGSGSEGDPIRVAWEKLMVFNEVDDGTIGYGALNENSTTEIAAGQWHVAAFTLNSNVLSASSCPSSPPTLNGPEGTVGDPTPFFSWTANSGTTRYGLRVTRADGALLVDQTGIDTTSFVPDGALPSGIPLRWQARRENGCGSTAFSAPKSFQLNAANSCPTLQAPTPLSPAGVIQQLNPTFSWTAVPGANAGYTLFALDPHDNFVAEVHNHHGTQWTVPTNLPVGVPLRWKVKAECGSTSGPYNEEYFSVGTGACEPTTAPETITPVGTITSARPTFEWTAIQDAPAYKILIQDAASGDVILQGEGITDLSWTPPVDLPRDRSLRWKVRVDGPCEIARYSLNTFFYVRTTASPTVTITEPVQGATMPESVVARASVSMPVQRVEFYLDGVLQATDTAPPYEFAWDTTVNSLPPLAPGRTIHMGYYFAEYKNNATFDATRAEVNGYTDTYVSSLSTYNTEPTSLWMTQLRESLQDAQAERKWIHLAVVFTNPDHAPYWDQILTEALPHWQRVLRIEVAHESFDSPAQLQTWIDQVRGWIVAHNLPMPPQGIGATANYGQPIPAWKNAPGLDWIGVEAYLRWPGSSTSQENVEQLMSQLDTARADIPDSKKIVMIPMGYSRNYEWTNIVTLRDIQTASYQAALLDPTVIGIDPFAYVRPSGTREYPELKTPHRLMSERILGVPYPGAGNGPRSLTAKAVTVDGRVGYARVGVWVRNRLFFDVALAHGARTAIENVWNAGVSEICGADALARATFCPETPIERRHVARWLVKARQGILYRPPAAVGMFSDVDPEDAPWVEDAVSRLILQPAAPGVFQPLASVSRGEMAIATLRALEGPAYQPPPCTDSVFTDVRCTQRLGPWVNELHRRGITTGCSPGLYCPNEIVSRWMMSVFVDRAF